MKKIKISPSILSADFSRLGDEIKRLENGGADLIHVDVMDGHFVPNLTIGPPVIKALRKFTNIPFDVHLMISPVHKYIEDYAKAGADLITIHPEATENLKDSINQFQSITISLRERSFKNAIKYGDFEGTKKMNELGSLCKELYNECYNILLNLSIEFNEKWAEKPNIYTKEIDMNTFRTEKYNPNDQINYSLSVSFS